MVELVCAQDDKLLEVLTDHEHRGGQKQRGRVETKRKGRAEIERRGLKIMTMKRRIARRDNKEGRNQEENRSDKEVEGGGDMTW